MISIRETKIIHKILSSNAPLRSKDFAESFGISLRTVNYDLENVRSFLKKHDIELKSKTGKGIWVECTNQQRLDCISAILKSNTNIYYELSVRIQKILLELFISSNFVTAEKLSELLLCSRATILKDMNYVADILTAAGIELVRKKGCGYTLGGQEAEIRKFFELHIQKSLTAYDIHNITQRVKKKSDKKLETSFRLLDLYYPNIEPVISKIYSQGHKNIILVIIRFTISIIRTKQGRHIGNSMIPDKNHGYAKAFLEAGLEPYKEEIHYINGEKGKIHIDISKLACSLIQEISEHENFPYHEDAALYSRLIMHLSLSVNGDILENPFNEAIQRHYKPLYLTIKEICERHIEVKAILNQSFLSYIVLHFLASKRNLLEGKKTKALLICATGQGAVRLIKKILEHEIKNLEIVGNCSLIEVESTMAALNPDIIISIFPIETDIPTAIVEPIPSKESLQRIRELCVNSNDIEEDDFLLSYHSASENAEDISLNVIRKGLEIYNAFTKSGFTVKENMEFAFLTHILIFAHRHTFNMQYPENKLPTSESRHYVRNIFSELNIKITDAELELLFNYCEGEPCH